MTDYMHAMDPSNSITKLVNKLINDHENDTASSTVFTQL